MDNHNDIFTLLAKLSSVETAQDSRAEELYKSLFSHINDDLAHLIDDSIYPRKSQLKKEFDDVLAGLRLFLRYPMLCGKAAAGILPGKSDAGRDLLRRLCAQGGSFAHTLNRNIPCILHDGQGESRITATTHTGTLVQLSAREYQMALAFYRSNIDVRDLLNSMAFSVPLKNGGVNHIVFPYYAHSSRKDYHRLAGLCSAFFLPFDKGADAQTVSLPKPIAFRAVTFYIVAQNVDDAAIGFRDALRSLWPRLTIELISYEGLSSVISRYERSRVELHLRERLLIPLLQLQEKLSASIASHELNIQALARDAVSAEDVQPIILELRKKEVAALESEQRQKNTIDAERQNILKLAAELEAAFQADMGVGEGASDMPASVWLLDQQIVQLALRCGDLALARQQTGKAAAQSDPCAYLYELYCLDAEHAALPEESLEKLRAETSSAPFILHAKIRFAHELGLAEEERDALAVCIPAAKRDKDEAYYAARHIERAKGPKGALEYYRSAADLGSSQACEWLAEHLSIQDGNQYWILKRLADRLEPTAAFLYGKLCLQDDRFAQGVTYLKIASSLGHLPAISHCADFLYDMREQGGAYLDTAITLYRYALSQGAPPAHVVAKIGVLCYTQEDYPAARTCFEQDHSLPEASYLYGCMYYGGNGVQKSRSMAEKYFEEAAGKGHPEAKEMLSEIKAEERSERDTRSSTRDYSPKVVSTSTSSGCFITTATCQSEGKADDCAELTAFRRYRDEVLLRSTSGRALVSEYYRIAPAIVERLSAESNAAEIYHRLYNDYIAPGYALLQQGQGDAAKKLYADCVVMLAEKYGVALFATAPVTDLPCFSECN